MKRALRSAAISAEENFRQEEERCCDERRAPDQTVPNFKVMRCDHDDCEVLSMGRASSLPKLLQPMLATLTDGPFDDDKWVFEDKYDRFRTVADIAAGKVTLYSRNGKIISHNYMEIAQALESVKGDAVIDGELVAIDKDGVSHFQLLQTALRHEAKLLYCAFDLMFRDGQDLRGLSLIDRKKQLQSILPRHKLISFSRHRATFGKKFFEEAERRGLEGVMAKRNDSTYVSGAEAR
jgi:bifunctional non-homologous end joining protein LigD